MTGNKRAFVLLAMRAIKGVLLSLLVLMGIFIGGSTILTFKTLSDSRIVLVGSDGSKLPIAAPAILILVLSIIFGFILLMAAGKIIDFFAPKDADDEPEPSEGALK